MNEFVIIDKKFNQLRSKNGVIEVNTNLHEKLVFVVGEFLNKYNGIEYTLDVNLNVENNRRSYYNDLNIIKLYYTIDIITSNISQLEKIPYSTFNLSEYCKMASELLSLYKYCGIELENKCNGIIPESDLTQVIIPMSYVNENYKTKYPSFEFVY